jgi:hypothetical protein
MPRWAGPRLTPAQRKARKREYDKARKVKRRNDVRPAELEETTTRYAPLLQLPTTLNVPGPKHGLKIAVLADAQVKPGVPIDHLAAYGRYLAEIRPDLILCIGDFADMASLSTYDAAGSLASEGQRYRDDIKSVRVAMTAFLAPIRKRASASWAPKLVLTLGNHEDRIDRAIAANPRQLQGVMSMSDLGYADDGWTVYPYLQPVTINGVVFCHYMPSGTMGRPITTAAALLRKMHMSCVVGHLQGRDIAYSKRADGSGITGIISGSFYQHDESYLSPFTNKHWRGTYVLNAVKDGSFDEMAIGIEYLLRKYA